jgi:2-polyprenyl-3-methyl-5-hydroxy-6-metoxy-1,4-benzoquinol methylase
LKIEITIEGPVDSISTLLERLRDFSPELGALGKHRGSLKIIETEKGLDSRLVFISRALKGMRGLELRVRNLAYSEPVVQSSDEPFSPIDSLLIQPWHPSLQETPDANTIFIDQQHAFGSGLHPTTILCLKGLEEIYGGQSSLRGKEILDFGCGTGLLAIVAAKWGARSAVGVEIDPDSVVTARRNVHLNTVAEKVTIVEGSWDAVDGAFDVIIANLVPSVLHRSGKSIRDYLKPQGTAIVSGFGEKQIDEMERFLESTELFTQKRTILNGWGALTLFGRSRQFAWISEVE